MPDYELTLRLDAPGAEADLLSEASQRVREQVYRELGLKAHSAGAWVSLKLGAPKAERALEALAAVRRAGRAIVGSATLTETLSEKEAPESDWSVLLTRQVSGSFSLWEDYPEGKLGTLPPVHALNHSFVSAAFVEACRRAGLAGIEFLRCANSGRKAGAPWFLALPARSLGNGLDHPWLDRARWQAHVQDRPAARTASVEVGQSDFHQRWLRPEAASGEPLLRKLLELCPPRERLDSELLGLKLGLVPRFLARVEPGEDFAYVPWGEDGPNREGKMMRFRLLALRRRARAALVEAGLFKAKDFYRVRSIAAPEPGVAVLDGRAAPVPPMFSPAELAALRAHERTL